MLFGCRARLAETTFLNAKFLFCVEIFFDRNYVSSAWIVWGEPMEVLTQVVKLVTSNSDGSTVRRRGPPPTTDAQASPKSPASFLHFYRFKV